MKTWPSELADKVLERFPDEEVYTCAAGISPSGIVHFGNFRDIATSLAVYKELKNRGKKVRFLFSWDDYDRFRKVPSNVDSSFEEYLGLPLADVPSPDGKEESYARYFQKQLEDSMKDMGIDVIDFIYQNKMYRSGVYADSIIEAMKKRKEIASILFSFMSEKSIDAKGLTEEDYVEGYYPISIFSKFNGKDNTEILEFDGESKVKYFCKDTEKEDVIDMTKDFCYKLGWKPDWSMRWRHEGVNFEPAGLDHGTPGGSYDVCSRIVREVFDSEPPVFRVYQMVGIQGLGAKMSGSKGNAVSPGQLLDIYEPEILKWLYMRKIPGQAFQLAFDSEVYRQYDEFDREVSRMAKGKLNPKLEYNLKMSGVESPKEIKPLPFRQAVALGQIVQWNTEKVLKLMEAMRMEFDVDSVPRRLEKAKNWLETYNPGEAISILENVNKEYIESMDDAGKEQIRELKKVLESGMTEIDELQHAVYSIPKDESLNDDENKKRQLSFFRDVYNLILGLDRGPRLGTFLWAVDKNKIINLLEV